MENENRAQFAKEAMQKQCLQEGSKEVLFVRWASEDKTQKFNSKKSEEWKNWQWIPFDNYYKIKIIIIAIKT